MAWIQSFAYQSPSQFSLEFSRKGIDLYVKVAFIFADGNLPLEVSDQTRETLEVMANFTKAVRPFRCRAGEAAVMLFICRTTRIIHRTRYKKKSRE